MFVPMVDRPGVGFVFTDPDETQPDVLLFPGDTLQWRDADGQTLEPAQLPDLLTVARYGLLVVSSSSRSYP